MDLQEFLDNGEFTIYETEHQIAVDMSKIIQRGTKFPIKHVRDFRPGPAIIYGRLRGGKEMVEENMSHGFPTIGVDHGYFSSRDANGHFRFCVNSFEDPGKLVDTPTDRWEEFGKAILPKKQNGEHIVILSPSSFWAYYDNLNPHIWDWHREEELKELTNLRVISKNKRDTTPLSEYLEGAAALVHYASMGALEALRLGVPVVTLGPSFLKNYTNTSISEINSLELPDREKLFCNLCYRQFTIAEIISGYAWETIKRTYSEAYNDY